MDASLPSSIKALAVMVRPLMSWNCTATTPRATPEFSWFQVLMVMQFSDSAVAIEPHNPNWDLGFH